MAARTEKSFKEIMDIFPNSMKIFNTQIQKDQQNSSRINTKNTISIYTIIKLLKKKSNKEKILKAISEKYTDYVQRRKKEKNINDFSSESM